MRRSARLQESRPDGDPAAGGAAGGDAALPAAGGLGGEGAERGRAARWEKRTVMLGHMALRRWVKVADATRGAARAPSGAGAASAAAAAAAAARGLGKEELGKKLTRSLGRVEDDELQRALEQSRAEAAAAAAAASAGTPAAAPQPATAGTPAAAPQPATASSTSSAPEAPPSDMRDEAA
jgi:hypothetical protein